MDLLRWPPPRVPGWSRWARERSNSAIRWPARRSTRPLRPSSVAPPIVPSPPRCPTVTWIVVPGTWLPRPPGPRAASAALEQAGAGAATAARTRPRPAAFERAARLAANNERRARLLLDAAEAAWHAGLAERAVVLLEDARAHTADAATGVAIDSSGHITNRRGPVMRGHEILTDRGSARRPRAGRRDARRGGGSVLLRGQTGRDAGGRRAGAGRAARQRLRPRPLPGGHGAGMARVLGGDAAAGAEALHQAAELAEGSPELQEDLRLLPWLTLGRSSSGRPVPGARVRAVLRPRGSVLRSARCRSCSICSPATRPRPIAGRSPRPPTRKRSVWPGRPSNAPS